MCFVFQWGVRNENKYCVAPKISGATKLFFRVAGTRKKFRTPQIEGIDFEFFQKMVLRDFAYRVRLFRNIVYIKNKTFSFENHMPMPMF